LIRKKGKKYGFGYGQNVGSEKGVVDFSFNPESRHGTFRVATNSKIDESSTLKSRFTVTSNKEFRWGVVLKQNLNASTRVTVTSDVNARSLFDGASESGPGHQFGVAVSFFD